MKTSETTNDLFAAIASAQADIPTLPKDKAGYGYKYTPLDTVVEAIKPILASHKLAYVQMPTTPAPEYNPAVALTTRLIHASGEWLEDTLVIPIPTVGKANTAQAYGAALTYARRYALTAMLGIVADEDADGVAPPPAVIKKRTPTTKPSATEKKAATAVADNHLVVKRRAFHAVGKETYGDAWDDKRPQLVKSISSGKSTSSNDLTVEQLQRLIDGMKSVK